MSIVKTIIGLGKNLKLNVVAEGTEEQDQVEALKENDCDSVQGYCISRPIPGSELNRFLEGRLDKAL